MTERDPKAKGMGWLSPHMIVTNVKTSLKFYEEAFGFKTHLSLPDKEGNIIHGEMLHKDVVMMLGLESESEGTKSPKSLGGTPVRFYLYVDNIEQQFERARAAGAQVETELEDQFWGDRTCVFICPEGHHWTFAQNVADFDPSKAPG